MRIPTVNEILNKHRKKVKEIPLPKHNYTIKSVINRIFNCKFDSAYEQIITIKGIDKKILKEFKKASIELGNCGGGGTLISKRADKLAGLLDYYYNEQADYYFKSG